MNIPDRLIAIAKTIVLLTLAIAISGCGGGGGGGGTGGNSGSGTVSLFQTSAQTVAFQGFRWGTTPTKKSVSLNVSSTRTVYVGVTFSGSAIADASLVIEDPINGIARIDVVPSPTNGAGLSRGANTGTVTIRGCYDAECVSEIPQSPKVISVTYDLKSIADKDELRFSSVEGNAPPAAQALNLDLNALSSQTWSAHVSYVSGSGWLHMNKVSGSGIGDQIMVSVDSLPAGTYQADLTVVAGGVGHQVFVTHVADGTLSASQPPIFAITRQSTTADLSKTIAILSNASGASPLAWSASANVPWLSLTPASGDTGTANQLAVALVGSQMAGLESRYTTGELRTHSAAITLNSPGLSPINIPVELTMDLPTVKVVSPNAVVSGSATEVILRGRGFLGATNVNFGNGAPVGASPRNDSEIRMPAPALTPGSYAVSISNSLGIARQTATINVVSPASYGPRAMVRPGTKRSVVYDNVRRAIYVANSGLGAIDKYSYDPGTGDWTLTTSSVALIDALALSIDGSYLLATTTTLSGTLHEIAPEDLSVQFTLSVGSRRSGVVFDSLNEAVLAPFGTDFSLPVRLPRNSAMGALSPRLPNTVSGASGDGRRILFGGSGGLDDVYYFDSGAVLDILPFDMATAGFKLSVTSIAGDRTGSKWILNKNRVYSGNFTYLYSLPSTTVQSVVSPDGSYAVALDSDGKVYRYSLGGTIGIAGNATPPAPPGTNPVMTISNDGNTVIVAGDQNVIVMPVP
jgi:hypothetical protein